MKNNLFFLVSFFAFFSAHAMEDPAYESEQDNWRYYTDYYQGQLQRNSGHYGIELQSNGSQLQVVPRYGVDKLWEDVDDESCMEQCSRAVCPCTTAFAVCALIPTTIACGFLIAHLAQGDPQSISDFEIFGTAVTAFACCTSPFVIRKLLFLRREIGAAFLTRSIANVPRLHPNLFTSIKKQDVDQVVALLKEQQRHKIKLPLDTMTDKFGRTPLLAAIAQADRKKDPDGWIVRELIAQGASLWYETVYRKIPMPQMEEGTPLLIEQDAPRVNDQPILKLLNRKELLGKVLKPICGLVQRDLVKMKKGSQDQALIRLLLASAQKSS